MFFILFILFCSKYFSANSLQCMTNKGIFLLSSSCAFELNINDPIPDDIKLTTLASKCVMQEANTIAMFGHSDGSCYGEISIDYNTKKMAVKLTHVGGLQSMQSPYDDMFGLLTGISSIVQYKINGNLEKEEVQMITRIQCKTYDNCALDKLRKLLSNLTISDTRLEIFKELKNFLMTSQTAEESGLTCLDNDDANVQCSGDENRCKFERSKGFGVSKGCTVEDSSENDDLEYRFNVIEEMAEFGTDNSAKALKCFYLCNTDNCNSDENLVKVDNLLNAFAMASKANGGNTNNNVPAGHTGSNPAGQAGSNKARSDGISFFITLSYRPVIVIALLMQILSN